MLVAEARYFRSWLAVMAAIFVPLIGSVAIARAAHLPAWAAFTIYLAMLFGIAYAILTRWLASVRNGSATILADPPARPARFTPFILSLAGFVVQGLAMVLTFRTFQGSRWTQGGDLFALCCILTAFNTFLAVRSWRSTVAERSGAAPLSPFTQKRLAQLAAARERPTKAARAEALRPLRARGLIRLALIALEVVLMLTFAPKIGISLALLSSFAIVAGIFLIGYRFFDL